MGERLGISKLYLTLNISQLLHALIILELNYRAKDQLSRTNTKYDMSLRVKMAKMFFH
jgi:hypothetical protein